MAEWLTERQLWTLALRYGDTADPASKAIEEACARSAEVADLWAARDAPIWAANREGFARLLWPMVLSALGIADTESKRTPADARESGADDHRGGAVNLGGRPRKLHPGLALREAARLIKDEPPNNSKVANDVTAAAKKALSEAELAAHRWRDFAWEDAELMRRALGDRLWRLSPYGLEIRENPHQAYRFVDDLEWLAIPQPG